MSTFGKLLRIVAASVSIILASTVVAAAYDGATGYAMTDLNLRAGPGGKFPLVGAIRGGDTVKIFGCTRGFVWCDVGWRGNHGWAFSRYLQINYHNRRELVMSDGPVIGIPVVVFVIDDYWRRYYPHHPFFVLKYRFR